VSLDQRVICPDGTQPQRQVSSATPEHSHVTPLMACKVHLSFGRLAPWPKVGHLEIVVRCPPGQMTFWSKDIPQTSWKQNIY